MLTVEIKVNGSIVKHIYAHNVSGFEVSEYDVVVADVVPYAGKGASIQEFRVTHERSTGIGALVAMILEVAK